MAAGCPPCTAWCLQSLKKHLNARMSLAFFQQPDWDACIDDLPTCLDPGETAQNSSVTSKRYRMERFHNTIHNTVLDEST